MRVVTLGDIIRAFFAFIAYVCLAIVIGIWMIFDKLSKIVIWRNDKK